MLASLYISLELGENDNGIRKVGKNDNGFRKNDNGLRKIGKVGDETKIPSPEILPGHPSPKCSLSFCRSNAVNPRREIMERAKQTTTKLNYNLKCSLFISIL